MPGEAVHLYGRDRAMELVREFLVRPETDGVPRSRPVPVLVFTGARGGGKTALLTELARRLDQQVPFARVDCETVAGPGAAEVLSALAFELNRRCGTYGRLAFPRLVTGQLVIAQQLDMTDRTRAMAQVEHALREYRKIDNLRDFLADTAPEVLSAVGGSEIPGVSAAGRYLPDLVLKGLVSWRRGRRVVLGEGQDWYGHQDRGLGRDSMDVLVDLNRRASRPEVEDNRREVAELLWAAFLADLRGDFRDGRRAEGWSLNCAVLVDNVDTPAGLGFLEGLIRARRQHAAHAPDDPDPLTVVATSRGVLAARVVAAGETIPGAEHAGYADYLARGDGRLDRGWYPVHLRDLSRDEVGNMVAALGMRRGGERMVATVVHGFTGGHPGATRLILDAIAERPEGAFELRAVLDAAEPGVLGPGAVRVEERLLRRLLEGMPEGAVDDLVTCAAADDIEQASRLAARSGLFTGSPAEQSSVFAPELWTAPGETTGADGSTTAVLRPVLRRLLLRRLADRAQDDPANWTEVHRWLAHDRVNAGDEAGELRYTLATGELEIVVRRLAEWLPDRDVLDWLRLLKSVAAAPNRFDHRLAPIDLVRELTLWASPRDLPMAPLARLVAALWQAGDPLRGARLRSLHLEIAADYNEIAPYSGNGLAVLRAEAEKHRAEAMLSSVTSH